MLYENYACGGVGNYNGYCDPEIDRMIEQQSREPDQEKRKRIVWEIERRLVEDDAKPLLYFGRGGLLGPQGQGPDHHGQQHLQRLAHGRRLARQIAVAYRR